MSPSQPPSGRSVAITGATGLIGKALCASFENDGWRVLRISRSAKGPDVVRWDLERGEIDTARLEGTDAVIHLAGESVAGLWTSGKRERIRQSRVKGTTLIAQAVAGLERPPDVLVSASAIGYYGDSGDEPVSEGAPPGDTFLADVCTAWEASAAPAANAGIRVVHPRIGVVLSDKGGALAAMKLPFKLGVGGRIGSGQQWMSWVHIQDLVQMIRFTIDEEQMVGPFNAVALEPVKNETFTEELGSVLSRPTFLPVPAGLAKLAGGDAAEEMLLCSCRAHPEALEEKSFEWQFPELRPALVDLMG